MKKIFICLLGLFCIVIFSSCSQDKINKDDTINQDDKINLNNIDWDISINFTTTYDLKKYDLNKLISAVVKELYETDMKEVQAEAQDISSITQAMASVETFLAVDFVFNFEDDILIVTPTPGIGTPEPLGDDEDCGGKQGDGWTSYGTCRSEVCVETKVREATAALSKDLTSGKCLDVRVKRNALSARVCARLIDC
jgi:hypothetical protein